MHQPATTNPLIIMCINMTIVFAVLIGLSFMIKFIHMIDPTKPKEKPAENKPAMVKLKDGREIPKDYYEACKKEWNGKKLVSIYEEDKELFNNLLTSGEPSFKAAAEVIKTYKEKKA